MRSPAVSSGRRRRDYPNALLALAFLLLALISPLSPVLAQIPPSPVEIPSPRNTEGLHEKGFSSPIRGRNDGNMAIRPYKPGELLIKYRRSSERAVGLRHRGLIASTLKSHERLGVKRVKLSEGTDVMQALESLRNDPDVEHAEPNYEYRTSLNPNDPYFNVQWGLHRTESPRAWEITSGATTVVVAVVDTGVSYTHPDLSPNIWVNTGEIPGNGLDDDNNGKVDDFRGWDFVQEDNDPMDLNGHGTHVAGIIAGAGNNGIGISGVSWPTKIMPVRGLNASGVGYISDLIEAIEYASRNGAHVINCSWGGSNASTFLKAAISSSPVLVICAAGNDSNNNDANPFYPSGYDCQNIVSVAATDQNDNVASFSNHGASSVHVGAPGVNIYSSYLNAYEYLNGTSMAAPHVSGIAALVIAQNPSLSSIQVKNAILNSVEIKPSLNGNVATGGRVNAFHALPPAGPSDLSGSNTSGNIMGLSWTDNSSNENGFKIERKMGSQDTWSQVGAVSENITSWQDSGADGSTVQYRVLAYNAAAPSIYSNTVMSDSGPPNATLTYSAPDLNHVDAGNLVITATFSELLSGIPGIAIDRPGEMTTITAFMSGTTTVWKYNLPIGSSDGHNTVDGPYTVSLTAEDMQGNNLGKVKYHQFTTDTKDFDNDGTRDYADADDDNDGLPDEWEIRYGMNHQNPDGVNGWDGDFDNDGWANWEEYLNHSDPGNAISPKPTPPAIQEANPRHHAGIKNSVLIPNNTAFAIRFKADKGIALKNSSGVTLAISDGVTNYTRNLNDTNESGVTLVEAVALDSKATSEKLWVVYYRANESGVTPYYPYEANVGVSVYATDIRNDSMIPEAFDFKIERLTDFVRAEENRPSTITTAESGLTKVEVDEGNLRGAAILYDESVARTGITPYFGAPEEIPGLTVSGANGVGVAMNLKPPAVFPAGLTLRIPVPGYSDVSSLYVYYYNGENWVIACNAAGVVQTGGEGWMIPGSRVNHNNGNPSTIEIKVYHFSAALAGSAPPAPSGGGDGGGGGGSGGDSSPGSTGSGGGSGGGGGCFIDSLLGGW